MTRIADLIASETQAAERAEDESADLNLPSHVKVTRGHNRSKVLQVRLNEDEFRIISKLAEDRGVPPSTFVRALILERVGH